MPGNPLMDLDGVFDMPEERDGDDDGEKSPASPRPPAAQRGPGVRERIFRLLDDPDSSLPAKIISIFVMILILLGTVAFVAETVPSVRDAWLDELHLLETVCVVSFTVDYVGRVLTYPEKGWLRYLMQPLNLIDVFSILPWYLQQLVGTGGSMAILRVLRMARVFRVMKVGGMRDEMVMFSRGVQEAMAGLTLLLFLLVIYLVLFGALMHTLEYDSHREIDKAGFESIPASIWFVVATLTTVGYGDVFPLTWQGKIMGSLCMLSGILVLALPIVLVGNAFKDAFEMIEAERMDSLERAIYENTVRTTLPSRALHYMYSRTARTLIMSVWRQGVANPLAKKDASTDREVVAAADEAERRRVKIATVSKLLAGIYEETKDERFRQCCEILSSR